MGGKAALIMVIGFSILMSYTLLNMNSAGTRAVNNMAKYNAMTTSHNLAQAATNVLLSDLYEAPNSAPSYSQTLNGMPFNGKVDASTVRNGNQITVTCVSESPYAPGLTVKDTVQVKALMLDTMAFSYYAWMTNVENGVYWITKDTVWGRVFSNDNLYVDGSPVFMKSASTAKGFSPQLGKTSGGHTNKAIFYSPAVPQTGAATIQLPTDLSGLQGAAQQAQSGSNPWGKYYTTSDIVITLNPGTSADGDGFAVVRWVNGSGVTKYDTIATGGGTLFNGVIGCSKNIYVQGTLDGRLSLAALGSSSDVIVTNNIKYESKSTSSTDMLGLIAMDDVIIQDNAANDANTDHFIDGSIFALKGSFTAENYDNGSPRGQLRTYGSIVQNTRGPVGTFNNGVLKTGYSKRYTYDDRLASGKTCPPFFPGYVRLNQIVNWWESRSIMELRDFYSN